MVSVSQIHQEKKPKLPNPDIAGPLLPADHRASTVQCTRQVDARPRIDVIPVTRPPGLGGNPNPEHGEGGFPTLLDVIEVDEERGDSRKIGTGVATVVARVVMRLVLLPGAVVEDLDLFHSIRRDAEEGCDFVREPAGHGIIVGEEDLGRGPGGLDRSRAIGRRGHCRPVETQFLCPLDDFRALGGREEVFVDLWT